MEGKQRLKNEVDTTDWQVAGLIIQGTYIQGMPWAPQDK